MTDLKHLVFPWHPTLWRLGPEGRRAPSHLMEGAAAIEHRSLAKPPQASRLVVP
jgi:hypothetical protein